MLCTAGEMAADGARRHLHHPLEGLAISSGAAAAAAPASNAAGEDALDGAPGKVSESCHEDGESQGRHIIVECGGLQATATVRCCNAWNLWILAGADLPLYVPCDLRNSQYYEKVSDPLDLSTIEKQILTGHYKTVEAFDSDMLKVFRNAEV